MDETAFIAWMKQRMIDTGITQTQLREAIGITSQSAVSNILNGKRHIKHDERIAIERALAKKTSEPDPEQSVRWVPLIGLAPAGSWREAVSMPMGQVPVIASRTGRRAFAVEVDGDSMNLILPEGGWAVVDPDQTHLYDKRVYLVTNAEHEATLKRYRSNPARLEPVSDNELHSVIYLAGENFQVVGRIVSYGNDQGLT
jgi:SOS-response transcriptional repressor LexA